MATLKLPSIAKSVAAAVKPSQDMVKSITSKLSKKLPKAKMIKKGSMGQSTTSAFNAIKNAMPKISQSKPKRPNVKMPAIKSYSKK